MSRLRRTLPRVETSISAMPNPARMVPAPSWRARRLVRNGDGAELENVSVLLSVKQSTKGSAHFGSRILVAPDGKLFVTIGDQGTMKRSQDFRDEAGSILRINADGTIPADNPFADGKKGLPQIWSKGHRNPQGAVWDPVTDSLIDRGTWRQGRR